MKAVLATALCICASASSSVYGGHDDKDDGCRDVKQERPVCRKHKRHVKEKFTLNDYKQKCHFEKQTKHDNVYLEVFKDVCKPHIENAKSKHVVHINNKVCEETKDGGYGDHGKKTPPKPDCKIVKEKRYIDAYDKVTKYSCHPEKDTKKVDVTLHYKKEVCLEYPEKHDEYVTLEVVETKCHVEKYTRRVCDDGPFDDKNFQGGYGGHDDGYGDQDKGGYGSKGHSQKNDYGGGYGDHEKGGYGDMGNSKTDDYGGGSKDGNVGYGDHDKGGDYGGYGDHEKGGYGYGDDSDYGGYSGSGYVSHDKNNGYDDHRKGAYGSTSNSGYHDKGSYGASSNKGGHGDYGSSSKHDKGGYDNHNKGGYGDNSSKKSPYGEGDNHYE